MTSVSATPAYRSTCRACTGAVPAATPAEEEAEADEGPFGIGRREEPIEIQSDELEMIEQSEQRHLVFLRNVRVVQGDVTMWTDRLDAFYPDGSSQPDRLVARGNVRVVQGERHAVCDRADYERDAQVIVCRGHAELFEGCDHVRGEKIHFDLEGERVRVTGGPSVVIYPAGTATGSCAERTS